MKAKNDRLSQVKRFAGAAFCVECGRCVAVCPMAEMYGNFSIEMSPRGIIRKALTEGAEILRDENLWYCTECNAGTDVCPQGVSCRDLIRGLREMVLEEGRAGTFASCRGCGKAFVVVPVERFVFRKLEKEPANVLAVLEYCPSCRQAIYSRKNA